MSARLLLRAGLVLALAGAVGCEEEIQVGRGAPAAPASATGPGPATGPGQNVGEAEDADAAPEIPSYRDEDFVEADSNRDPFHNFASVFVAVGTEGVDRGRVGVVMPDTGVEEMRLIGIVTGSANPHAMLVDRSGVGHTVRRGVYLGRSEVVQAGGTEELPVTLNWRVVRIRPDEVVIAREDPTAPNRPPLTRVIQLRDEEETLALGGVRTVEQGGPATSAN